MYRIRANLVVKDIRLGIGDEELRKKYELPLKVFRQLLQMLVSENAVEHRELYENSPTYREMADVLAARRSPRTYVPVPIRVNAREPAQKGFIRDISETGLRVAGIEAQVGASVKLSVPPEEIHSLEPLEFTAVCRWAKTEGKVRKYVLAGFEITEISENGRRLLRNLVELFGSQSRGYDRTLCAPLRLPDVPQSCAETKADTEASQFEGIVQGVDILDFVQFMLLSGKKTVLAIESYAGDAGELYLDEGRIVHAHRKDFEGTEAFFQCMSFRGGSIATRPWAEPIRRTVQDPGDFLLLEAARRRDESLRLTQLNGEQKEGTKTEKRTFPDLTENG